MTKQLARKEISPVVKQAQEYASNLTAWADYATTQASVGNLDELRDALVQVKQYAVALADQNQLTADVIAGLQQYSETIQVQLKRTAAQRDEAEQRTERDIVELAMEIARTDRANDDTIERTRIEAMAERMRDDGTPDFVLDEERKTTEYLARKAWQLAQQEAVEDESVA